MTIQPGLQATAELTVSDADTASALGSGDVDVLGTPRVVALCEEAAVRAVASALDAHQTTVGTRIDLAHVVPTVIGRRAEAHARLERVDGRTLEFVVVASDESGEIARGTHTRVIVDRDRFLRGAADRGR